MATTQPPLAAALVSAEGAAADQEARLHAGGGLAGPRAHGGGAARRQERGQAAQFFRSGKHPCAYCGHHRTEVHGYAWRPMFMLGRIVWVLHRRWRCLQRGDECPGGRGKRRSFASISPTALSKLPTQVSERFEFVTTVGGPGLRISLFIGCAGTCSSSPRAWGSSTPASRSLRRRR